MRRYASLAVLLTTLLAGAPALAQENSEPASAATAAAKEAPAGRAIETMSDADLERMLAPLGGDDVEARRAAAKSVASLGQDAVPVITKQLATQRKANTIAVAAAVKAARDATRKSAESTDLCDALLETKSEGGAPRRRSDSSSRSPATTATRSVRRSRGT